MIESIVGTVLGGILRMAPEAIAFFDKKNERKHELDMMAANLEADKFKASAAKDLAIVEGQYKYDIEAAKTLAAAVADVNKPTGIKWVDAFTSSVRPAITYMLVLGYIGFKIQAISMGATMFWNDEDTVLLSTVLSFWFVNRSLEKWRR